MKRTNNKKIGLIDIVFLIESNENGDLLQCLCKCFFLLFKSSPALFLGSPHTSLLTLSPQPTIKPDADNENLSRFVYRLLTHTAAWILFFFKTHLLWGIRPVEVWIFCKAQCVCDCVFAFISISVASLTSDWTVCSWLFY